MEQLTSRTDVRFRSGDDECAAWYYPSRNGACVVMAGGFGVPKEPGTDPFAVPFHEAGFGVLAFDYRGLGASGGTPRLVQRIDDQLADWDAALAFAATLPGVRSDCLAIWGFSLSGGHVFRVAARHPELVAAIAQTPNADGRAATRNALRFQSAGGLLRLFTRAVRDQVGGRVGREPLLVPLAGPRGTVALLSTPDAIGGGEALGPDNRYPDWAQAVAARSALQLGSYRPGSVAADVRCPLLVVVCDDDRTALVAPSVEAAGRAPDAEVVHLPGGHYAPFLDQHDAAVTAELAFLHRAVDRRPGTQCGGSDRA